VSRQGRYLPGTMQTTHSPQTSCARLVPVRGCPFCNVPVKPRPPDKSQSPSQPCLQGFRGADGEGFGQEAHIHPRDGYVSTRDMPELMQNLSPQNTSIPSLPVVLVPTLLQCGTTGVSCHVQPLRSSAKKQHLRTSVVCLHCMVALHGCNVRTPAHFR
jgi:hypothetical protein